MFICTIATQRSGTKFLGSMFNTGNQISSLGEIFNPDLKTAFSFRTYLESKRLDDLFDRGSEPLLDEYLQGLLQLRGAIHFDLMFNQFEFTCLSWNPYPDNFILNYLKSRKTMIILLTRDPKQILESRASLAAHNVPHFPSTATSIALPPPSVVESDIETYSDELQKQYSESKRFFRSYNHFLQINYDDINEKQAVPLDLIDKIRACAKEHGRNIDPNGVQMAPPPISRPTRWKSAS